MACWSCPLKEEADIWTPNRFPQNRYTYCSDINPQLTIEKAHKLQLPLIQLWTRSLRGISRNSKVTLHVCHLLRIRGTIYSQYTITPLLNLSIPLNKVHQLAETRSQQQDTKCTSTTTTVTTGYDGGVTGRAAGFRRRPDRMAPQPIQSSPVSVVQTLF
jgi:hypothetical protein